MSPISINSAGSSSTYINCSSTGKSGLTLTAYGSNSSGTIYGGLYTSTSANQAIGLRGNASYGDTSIGVMGYGTSGAKNIGLLGSTITSIIGVGVYGTVYGDYGSALSSGDLYAGFFRGNVKVTGNIVASTTIQGALLGESSSESGAPTHSQSLRSASVTDGLSGLFATTYQKERQAQPEETEAISAIDGTPNKNVEKPQPDIIDEQFGSQRVRPFVSKWRLL